LRGSVRVCQDVAVKNSKTAESNMSSVARVTEIIASSKKSFEDALDSGVKRATKTLKNVAGAWVASQDVVIVKGKITEYRVRLKVTFVLAE
jgi:flavin-binding protein dodecin